MTPAYQRGTQTADTSVVWRTFRQEVARCDARLILDLRSNSDTTQALVSRQLEQFALTTAHRPSGRSIDAATSLYQEPLAVLLSEPLEAYRRARPQHRVLSAFDDDDRSLEQLIDVIPDTLECSGAEWVALIGAAGLSPATWMRLRLRRRLAVSPRLAFPLGVRSHRAARHAIEGRLLVALAGMSLELSTPWQAMRRAWFSPIASEWVGGSPDAELAGVRSRMSRHVEHADRALADVEVWLSRAPGRIAHDLIANSTRARKRLAILITRDEGRREYLRRQSRAVDADLDLEAGLSRAEASLFEAARDVRASIEQEHRELLDELDRAASWLERWRPGDTSAFPPAVARVIPGASRLRAFSDAASSVVRRLPESVEVSSRLATRPGLRRAWTVQTPRAVINEALDSRALPLIAEWMRALERQHQGIVLEIERAREVVSFAGETARSGPSLEPRIEQEGIANANALLQFHRQQVGEIPPDVEPSLVTALLRAFDRTHRTLDEGGFGILRQAARLGLPKVAQVLWHRIRTRVRAGANALVRLSGRAYRSALVRIGWVPAPPPPGTHVATRGYLTRSLDAESKCDQLPLIYQRLFRLVPVEDARFLVGRQEELAAVADARGLWEEGRAAAVLLVGARGSGKTSLINCAAQQVLSGCDVIRSEFADRLTTRDEMYGFLSRPLGVGPGDVDRELTSTRRVIVLEELERTFLRKVGCYEAIRALAGLVSRTSRQNLWLLSINHASFRLLQASLRLQPHFSHQIDAMAVEQAHLREALLVRHNLSGLRLHFASPADQDSYARRLLRATGMQTSKTVSTLLIDRCGSKRRLASSVSPCLEPKQRRIWRSTPPASLSYSA